MFCGAESFWFESISFRRGDHGMLTGGGGNNTKICRQSRSRDMRCRGGYT